MCIRPTQSRSPQHAIQPHSEGPIETHFASCFAQAMRVTSVFVGVITLIVYAATKYDTAIVVVMISAACYVLSWLLDPPLDHPVSPASPTALQTNVTFANLPRNTHVGAPALGPKRAVVFFPPETPVGAETRPSLGSHPQSMPSLTVQPSPPTTPIAIHTDVAGPVGSTTSPQAVAITPVAAPHSYMPPPAPGPMLTGRRMRRAPTTTAAPALNHQPHGSRRSERRAPPTGPQPHAIRV